MQCVMKEAKEANFLSGEKVVLVIRHFSTTQIQIAIVHLQPESSQPKNTWLC